MKSLYFFFIFFISIIFFHSADAQNPAQIRLTREGKGKVNPWIDNMGYWKEMVRKGYVLPDPYIRVPEAHFTSSIVEGDEIRRQNSPDIPTSGEVNTTQSENSVFLNPLNDDEIFNSNNSTTWNGVIVGQLFGVDHLFSDDAGASWGGSIQNAGDYNSGDPAAVIGLNGRQYVGKINIDYGQSVAWSDDKGQTWNEVVVASVPSPGLDILDKNHLCIDNSPGSPYQGNLYCAWTTFINNQNGRIEISRSVDQGLTWQPSFEISQGANAVANNQGVNLQTGPNGQVYATWSVYDDGSSDEVALGFARSLNGGSVFLPATRIINNIRGIRATGVSKNMRVNSFPSMAVDISGGSNDGAIYIVWANIGEPGINNGSDVDIYCIRSFDEGSTWSQPVRVNQDPAGLGKKHYLPWITCDPDNGNLAVIYYDDRNCNSFSCETYISYSYDAGETWSDLKVSDVSFTPAPISGLASSYFGDYLGITAKNRTVYPVWTDNRDGRAMSYVSPVDLGPAPGQSFVVYDSETLSLIGQPGTTPGMGYGDSLYLNLTMKNLGDQPASGVTCYLSSVSPYVAITDSMAYYGDFLPGEAKEVQHGFSFSVSDTIPDNTRIKFNVRAVSTDTLWNSHFALKAMAPGLKITAMKIYDTLSGNHNHSLDPGETAQIVFTLANTGDYPCENTYSLLQCSSEFIELVPDSAFSGTLAPGSTTDITFNVNISEEATFGSWVSFLLNARSGKYSSQYPFVESVGSVVEDWETGNFSKYPWTFGGNANWNISQITPYEGDFCAKSRPIFDEQSSVIKIDYTSGVPDSISFWLRTSSEPTYDFLYFYIDGIQQGKWSGEVPWTRVSFPTLPGTHNYKWSYIKDIFYSTGDDCAWIDFIKFPPPVLPNINAGADDTLCQNLPYQLNGQASGYDSLRWFTTGDGNFSNDTLISPIYTPGTGDVNSGSVKLRMTAWAANGSSSNSMILHIGSKPVTHGIRVWPNDTICTGQSMELSLDTVAGCHYSWSPWNFITNEIVIDTALTGGPGTFMVRGNTISGLNCISTDSVRIVLRSCTGMEDLAQPAVSIKPNPFKTITRIQILAEEGDLSVQIVDQKGMQVKKIAEGKYSKGLYTFAWDGKNETGDRVVPGNYLVIVSTAEKHYTCKLIFTP